MADNEEKTLVLVTGPSGAGRSTAINALEDIGFEAIDNLPLSLVPAVSSSSRHDRPLALGIDVRNRDFSTDALRELIDTLDHAQDVALHVLYLDAEEDVLIRRYSETRRRHPLSFGEHPKFGIAQEMDLLLPIKHRANILIDTSELTPHDLKRELSTWFAPSSEGQLGVSIQSFSYKRGLPRGLDTVLDCRFLRNPYWEPALRALDGRDPLVQDYVRKDPRFAKFFSSVNNLVQFMLPASVDEGKTHLSFGFGCTGGQHRSVTISEILAKSLAEEGWRVSLRHREIERRNNISDVAAGMKVG